MNDICKAFCLLFRYCIFTNHALFICTLGKMNEAPSYKEGEIMIYFNRNALLKAND